MKYQRFVAYIYEYRKGKKEGNCGFLRVESREGRITVEIHMKCPGLPVNEKCNIYGFVRNSGLIEGIPLGSACSGKEKLDCIIESEKASDAPWKLEFQNFGGMIIMTENGAFFGTEWDDQPIKPDNFLERKIMPSKGEKIQEKEEQNDEFAAELEQIQEPEFLNQKELDIVTEESSLTMDSVSSQEYTNTSQMEDSSSFSKGCNQKNPAFCPFDDEEFTECRKIHPNEFFKSCPPACALRNNRFLEHGYYNFRHILVGKRADGRKILGVPGGYDQQERFMANMFGFPYFKESREIHLPGGRGGYWYRLINASDTNQGNRLY